MRGTEASEVQGRSGAVLVVDLFALRENYLLLRKTVGQNVEVAATIKADAYGLGADRVGAALRDAGCRTFFVTTADEGQRLRGYLPDAEIFVLEGAASGLDPDLRLIPVLNHEGDVEALRQASRNRNERQPAALHVDTGMNRLGFALPSWKKLFADSKALEGIELRLVLSHLACADEPDHPLNALQLERFRKALATAGKEYRASLANSPGSFLGPPYRFNMVRPGAALYGINPTREQPNPMRTVARLLARVLQVREIDQDETVGYGAAYRARSPRRLATVSVGYADGLRRCLSEGGSVAIGGRRAGIAGRVSMDLVTVDVSEFPPEDVGVGTLVEILGDTLTVDDVARDAGTIGYEILTGIGARVPRIHTERPT